MFVSAIKNYKKLRQKLGLKKGLHILYTLKRQYGFLTTLKFVINKLKGRPLFYKIQQKNPYISVTERHNNILIKQQSQTNQNIVNEFLRSTKNNIIKISIVMPLYNPSIHWLEEAIKSVINQYYPYWELILVDDGSTKIGHLDLIKKYTKIDKRIVFYAKKENGGISKTTNFGVNHSKYPYIALMDQDDLIPKDCLYWFAKEIYKHPLSDFIYSDECKIYRSKKYFDFYFKPDWSPFLLYSHMYTSHMTVYKKELINKIGGFRSQYDFSQDYDFALRASLVAKEIRHIERVLYFWRFTPSSGSSGGKDYAKKICASALLDYFKNLGFQGKIVEKAYRYVFVPDINIKPLISIIIPSDSANNLTKVVKGILKKTNYKNIEIVIVTKSSLAKELSTKIRNEKVIFSIFDKKFNFSAKCNEGARKAKGEFLVFYNDDVFPKKADWLDRLLDVAILPNVGSVSPCCIYKNNAIQYAGMYTGTIGLISTAFISNDFQIAESNTFNHFLMRNVSIMSGACSIIRKDVFFEVGGFNQVNTPNGHSDVDLSFKLIKKGYNCVYNPDSLVIHIGNHTWHAKNEKDKSDIYLFKTYPDFLSHDSNFTYTQKLAYATNYTATKYKIFAPKEPINVHARKDILFISHELTNSGAPLLLLDVINCSIKNNYFPVVVSFKDGPLKNELLNKKIPLIIYEDASADNEKMFARFANNFDVVFANTIATGKCVDVLQHHLPKVKWWVHEAYTGLNIFESLMPKEVTGNNIKIYSISNYSKKAILTRFPNYKIDILNCGKEYIGYHKFKKTDSKKINFIFIGNSEKRKGLSILLKSVDKLPLSYKRKIHITIIGEMQNESSYNTLINNRNLYTHITRMEQAAFLKLFNRASGVIIPSLEETLSLVALEAMFYKIPFICSDEVGIIDYLPNEIKNKIIFKNNDVNALREKIIDFINNYGLYKNQTNELHSIYLKKFSYKKFNKDIINILDN